MRLSSLWRLYNDGTEKHGYRHSAFMGLLRLFIGDIVDTVDWKSRAASPYLNELRDHVHHLMSGTVERRLKTWYPDAEPVLKSTTTWILYTPPRSHIFSPKQKAYFTVTTKQLAEL